MTKAEILKKQQERCDKFISFIKSENFIETTDNVGNFASKMPVFYKKVSENIFLAFNIPTFGNIRKFGFHADFWKVIAKSESEFLNSKVEDNNLIALRLSFDLERDLSFFKEELSNY